MTSRPRATRCAPLIGGVSGILSREVSMYLPLVPCPSCQRHVLATEAACPFCAAALPSDLGSRAVPGTGPGQRLGRAAAFVFGASLAVTACAGSVTTGSGSTESAGASGSSSGGPDDDGGVMTHYGNPGFDA